LKRKTVWTAELVWRRPSEICGRKRYKRHPNSDGGEGKGFEKVDLQKLLQPGEGGVGNF